jgi:DNA-binding IclR family transcriptional regulator
LQNDQARSIKRTLEVLEYFDEFHPSASVGEIARELGYPQSSTSILLKSLMVLGYLAYDEKTRTYRPTARVAMLGRRIRPYFFGDGNVMAALNELNERTGELIFIAARAGFSIHYIYVVPAINPLRMHLRAGATRPVLGSAIGHLFLSTLPDDEVARTVQRAAQHGPKEPAPDLASILRSVRDIRQKGYVLSDRTMTPGGGVLAMMLPGDAGGEPMAICLGGVGSVILENSEKFVAAMHDVIERHVVPKAPSPVKVTTA